MHFEDVTESEMYASSEGSRNRKVDDVQMVISSQGEETDATEMENKASSFSTFQTFISAFFQRFHYQEDILRQSMTVDNLSKGINLRITTWPQR